jgi:predicted extracellular nuclease
LVKKDLGVQAQAISNRDMPVEVQAYQGRFAAKFSRDVAELRLFADGELKLILLLTHLKSKLSSDQDFQGRDRRTAEAVALAGFYNRLRAEIPNVPIVVGGDLNSTLDSPELEALRQTDLTDFHDVLQTPAEERVSFVHFDYKDVAHPQVLDYLLVSPHLKEKIVPELSRTFRYKSFYDIAYPLPKTPGERFMMPSDHFPLVLTLTI